MLRSTKGIGRAVGAALRPWFFRPMAYGPSARQGSSHSSASLSAFLNAAPDAMLAADAAGHIVLVNRQTEIMFGYEPGELLGQPIELLVPHRHRFKHTHDRARYHARNTVSRPMGAGLQVGGLCTGGSERDVGVTQPSRRALRGR